MQQSSTLSSFQFDLDNSFPEVSPQRPDPEATENAFASRQAPGAPTDFRALLTAHAAPGTSTWDTHVTANAPPAMSQGITSLWDGETHSLSWVAEMVQSIEPMFYKDDSSRNTISLRWKLRNVDGRAPTPEEMERFRWKVNLLRADDMSEVKGNNVLVIKREEVCKETGLVTMHFRINKCSRNLDSSPFKVHVSPVEGTENLQFEPFSSNQVTVMSKSRKKNNINRKRKRHLGRNPAWLAPWSLAAYDLLQRIEFCCLGAYQSINGLPDVQRPLWQCPVCASYQTEGHRSRCELRAILKTFKSLESATEAHHQTINSPNKKAPQVETHTC